jgi:outer membrane lipoprotein-sorting protein
MTLQEKTMKKIAMITLATLVTLAFSAFAQAQSADELVQKSLNAYLYPADDGKAEISMSIVDSGGGERAREMVMVRKDTGEDGGDQKYFIYFKEPGDVREMTFMVFKNVGKEDERWLFVPSVKLIRKIAADDKRSSFVGSDFVYEDVSGRSVDQGNHSLEGEAEVDGRAVYVVKSTPNDNVEYTYKKLYIDKENYLPLKEEFFGEGDKLIRTFTATNIADIDGFPTPMTRTMENHVSGGKTVITIEEAKYNVGLNERDFSERRMRRPPRQWIR